MTQYISTTTENILEVRQAAFHFRGMDFPGLVDEETKVLYDHPQDSYNKAMGLPTALEEGLIVPIHGEKIDWKVKLRYIVPSMIKEEYVCV